MSRAHPHPITQHPAQPHSAVESGSRAFLHQAQRNSRERYLASLAASGSGANRIPAWDICILTASDERQAEMVRGQIEWRREAGLLPARTQFLVVADPHGRRIGSGGATLRILSALYDVAAGSAASYVPEIDVSGAAPVWIEQKRVLVIHSGGDSRRLPHCSAVGKLFARIPRTLPDGRASTIFDEFLINLSGVAGNVPPGVLLVSGDVLLLFDHLQLGFPRNGVTGVAVSAPASLGLRHGVYVRDADPRKVKAFLHKATRDELERQGAIDKVEGTDGRVQIDTGLVWLDASTARRWAQLCREEAVAKLMRGESASALNLYADLLLPAAPNTRFDHYLHDTSDGPETPELHAARRILWERLYRLPFHVECLQPAVFVHFGTSEEYWRMVAADAELAHTCGWSALTSSWVDGDLRAADDYVLINSELTQPALNGDTDGSDTSRDTGSDENAKRDPLLVVDSRLSGGVMWQGRGIVANVVTDRPLRLARDCVVHQLAVGDVFVTRLFGLTDDPKRARSDHSATFMGRPWQAWLDEMGIDPALIWPDVPESEQTLWNAQLFPHVGDREASLDLVLPLSAPRSAPAGWKERWSAATRLSLAQSFAHADCAAILTELSAIEDGIAARAYLAAVAAERPAAQIVEMLGAATTPVAARRAQQVAEQLAQADPVLQLRGFKALAEAAQRPEWEDRAFIALAQMIESDVSGRTSALLKRKAASASGAASVSSDSVRVEAAARLDFGGGWTDTPPYSIEMGGTVLNAAVALNGQRPIIAKAERIIEHKLLLESRDIGETLEPATAGEVLAYANPADPFALLKASLVLKGIVPADTPPHTPITDVLTVQAGGLRLATQTTIPRGSGLGTSSIMAGAVLAALDQLMRVETAQAQRFDEVLCLEQMLTTGGGWQDQVGGLVGGIKLATSGPGLPQQIDLEPVRLAAQVAADLSRRMVLVYTGQQRLAKNLLRAVMGRWMARDPEMVWILGEIGRLAVAMRNALMQGNVDEFGRLLGEHWALNKRMDPGCTNPFLDDLFAAMEPHIFGGKLAGAGGGGFAFVIARDEDALQALNALPQTRYAGAPVALWQCEIVDAGFEAVQR